MISNSSVDSMMERMSLKSQLMKWKLFSIVAITALAIYIVADGAPSLSHIARISIDGVIFDDTERDSTIREIAADDSVKAVILHIDSPGGTMTGGEELYLSLRKIAEKKPLIAVIGGTGASGGYMAALAADRIIARKSSVTGSIGVLLQTAEATELAKKIGVEFITFKSGELKGSPSPFEKLSPKVTEAIDVVIKDSFDIFVEIVAERRNLKKDDVLKLADGRIFSGRQASHNKLIDEIGGEDEAIKWLNDVKKISKDLKVRDRNLYPEKSKLDKIISALSSKYDIMSNLKGGRIMALWNM